MTGMSRFHQPYIQTHRQRVFFILCYRSVLFLNTKRNVRLASLCGLFIYCIDIYGHYYAIVLLYYIYWFCMSQPFIFSLTHDLFEWTLNVREFLECLACFEVSKKWNNTSVEATNTFFCTQIPPLHTSRRS